MSGGAGRYSDLDDRALLVRVADKVDEMYQEWPEIKAAALAHPRIESRLDVAMRLVRPWHERYAPAALVVLVAVFVTAYLVRGTSARASETSPRVQAIR